MRRITLTILSLGLACASSVAYGHAFLDHAIPRVGSSVDSPPTVVKIWFTQELEPAFSAMIVTDANGNEVDKKDTHVDDSDKTLLIVSMAAIPPGTYNVSWHVVSVDTHRTQGDFKFTVKP